MEVGGSSSRLPHWTLPAVLVSAVLVVGLACSWGLMVAVEHRQAQHLSEVMDQRAQAVEIAVNAEITRYTDALADLAVSVGAQTELTQADFEYLTSSLSPTRLPGSSAAALVVPASDTQVPQVQRLWRSRGNRQLVLEPAKAGAEHFFVVLSRSLDGKAVREGRDISQVPESTQVLLAARDRGKVSASPTYVLLKDRGLPAAQQQLSFVLAAPIYSGTASADASRFQGWIVVSLRGTDFLTQTLKKAAQKTVAITLFDASESPSGPVPVAHFSQGPVIDDVSLRREINLDMAGRPWELQMAPATGISTLTGPALGLASVIVGVMLTVLLSILVAALSTSRQRALSQVTRATADLRTDIRRRQEAEAEIALLNAELERRVQERTADLEISTGEFRAFAYSVSHDLRTPLRSLHGYSDVLIEEYSDKLDATGVNHLKRIQANTTRMAQIIDDMLRLSRSSASDLHREELDLGDMARTIQDDLHSLEPGRHVELLVSGPLPADADALLMRLALQNLLTNAWKFTSHENSAKITIGSLDRDGETVFFVRDNGAGFDPEFSKKLFEPFQRLHSAAEFEGTGIGLAIVQRIIIRHGGDIWAESSPERGATFFFTIPLPTRVLEREKAHAL